MASNSSFKLVIFDCDGVLVDSEPVAHRTMMGVLEREGIVLGLDEAYREFLGRTREQVSERIGQLLGRDPTDAMAAFDKNLIKAIQRELRPMEGIESVLATITTPFCVCSNSSVDRIHLSLKIAGLLSRFDGRIFSAAEVERPKPAPDLFLYAARAMRVAPIDCCVVEDSVTGVKAARAAKMTVFGFTRLTPVAVLASEEAITFSAMTALPGLLGDARLS